MSQALARRHIETILRYAEDTPVPTLAQPDDVIGRSWKRCLSEYGLDPCRPRPARIVTHQTLREHQDSADEFLNVARAGVEQLYTHIASLGYVLLLSDYRGITVQFLGKHTKDERLRQAGLYLGADWSERYAGTCAVGTCIQEQTALTCHRVDHFDSTHISLTCTAAPIRDPHGNLLAVLDISALDSPTARDSQNFALHLTLLYARMIEDAYFLRRYRDSLIFRCDASREFVQVNGQLLFALDAWGEVMAANTAARQLMVRADQGGSLPTLLDCNLQDILAIPYNSVDGVRAFRVQGLGETLFGTLIEPKTAGSRRHSDSDAQGEDVPEIDRLAADDPAMRRTLSLAKRLRNRDVGLLILGETGTGKEVLSRAIHRASNRAGRPFIAVNCASIPESLIESELFGYAPGAFTGGRAKGAKGLIQQADGGTLFLDEIGDMPLHLQTRLLRVLAEGEVLPLGANQPITISCRVVAATHCDIGKLVEEGQFRADLYYRLNGAILKLPPLRERADKQHVILSVLARVTRYQARVRLRADAMSALLAYHWPGNIRQLANALTFAEATCDGHEITVSDLPEDCLSTGGAIRAPLIDPAPPAGMEPAVDAPEQEILLRLLRRTHWNISEAARSLNISRPTLYRRMRQYGLVPPNWRDH